MKRTVLNRILIAAGGILLLPVLFVTGRTYGVLCRMVPSLGRSFHSKTLISGGAFDQSGLLNLLLITLLSVLFILSAKLTAYAVPAFRRQPHRLILNAVLSIAYLLPIYSAVVFTWHLFRLIAVMGITPALVEPSSCAGPFGKAVLKVPLNRAARTRSVLSGFSWVRIALIPNWAFI